MPNIFTKLKNRFTSSSNNPPSKSKSTSDLATTSSSQQQQLSSTTSLVHCYSVKEKDLPKLHFASWKGNLDKVTELSRPDKINSLDKEGRTPLHLAVAANHLAVTQHLLTEDAKLQVFDKDNRSPLIIAVQNGNLKMMELLLSYLDQKNLINIPDRNGLSVLFYTIRVQNGLSILKLLFKKNLANKSLVDKEKNTVLHYAIIQKNYDAIVVLLENGLDIDAQNIDGRTPLMLAALSGDEKLTEYLLEYGADKVLKDNSGQTAIDLGIKSRNEKCIDLLKQNRHVKSDDVSAATESTNIIKEKEKFDQLFSSKKTPQATKSSEYKIGHDEDDDDDDEEEDDEEEEDEEETQATGGKIVLSHDKSDKGNTWTEDDEDDDDDDDDEEEESQVVLNLEKVEEYTNLFSGIQTEKQEKTKTQEFDTIIAGGGSFVNSKAENEQDNEKEVVDEEEEGDEDWPDIPSTVSIQKKINNQSQPTFSTFFPTNKAKETDDSTDGAYNWSIFVYTGNIKNAGTDAGVYLQIFGTKTASTLMQLDNKNGNNKKLFEAGSCDKFDKNLPDIGKPAQIIIGHNNKGLFPGWFLEKVIIQNNITNEQSVFIANRWLSKDELDHKIELELSVEKIKTTKETKTKQRTESSSSWNSSEDEDEDSLSTTPGFKKSNPTTPKSNTLKIIDEEKFNESKLIESSFYINKNNKKNDSIVQGPPEISDFEDSTEDDNKKRSTFNISTSPVKQMSQKASPAKTGSFEESEGALSFLAKASYTPKQTESPTKQKDENEGALSFLAKAYTPTKQQSFESPMKKQSSFVESESALSFLAKSYTPKQMESPLKQQQKQPQTKSSSLDLSDLDENKSMSIDALINSAETFFDDEDKKKSNETIKALAKATTSPTSSLDFQISPTKLVKNEKSSSNARQSSVLADRIKSRLSMNSIEDLDLDDPKSQSIGDLIATVDNILVDKPAKSTPPPPLPQQPPPSSQPQMGIAAIVKSEINRTITSDNILFTNSQTVTSSSSNSNQNTPGLKQMLKTEKVYQKRIAQLEEEENRVQEIHLISSSNQSNNIKNFNDSELNDFNMIQEDDDEDDDDDDDEFFNDSKIIPASKIGTIGTAIGSIIGTNALNQVTTKSSQSLMSNKTQKKRSSFANLANELYDKDTNQQQTSPDHHNTQISSSSQMFSNSQNLKSKQLELEQIKQLLDEMRKKNNELSNEKHMLEIKLTETESKKKTFEQVCSEKEKQLAEKETLIYELSTQKHKTEMASKLDSQDNFKLQKEIKDLKEKNQNLESKLSATRVAGIVASSAAASDTSQNFLRLSDELAQQPLLASQNESLTVRVKALESQIDELNKDREQLIIYRDELITQLNEKENDVTNQNEALKKATLQYLMEKTALLDENSKSKNELTVLTETKMRLNSELDLIKEDLTEKKFKYEQLNMTRLNLEQQLEREKNDSEKHLQMCTTEMKTVRDQLIKLNEKLSITEAKLIATENDLKYTRLQIDDRQKQINELKTELDKSKSELVSQMDMFRKEKEEKESILKKCDALEESIKKNLDEIDFWKKKHQKSLILDQQQGNLGLVSAAALNDIDDPSFAIELENKRLQNDLKSLNEKLEKAEKELVELRQENEEMKNHHHSSRSKNKKETNKIGKKSTSVMPEHNRRDKKRERDSSVSSLASSASSQSSIDTAKIKTEIKNLKNDFKTIMSKYEQQQQQPQAISNNINNSNVRQQQQNQQQQRENIDVPGLITDLPLKTVASLNNYLIKNIIKQEDPNSISDNNNNLHVVASPYRSCLNEPITHLILSRNNNMYATSADIPPVNDLIPTHECERCFRKNKSYLDSLKHELNKRIEYEAIKDVPFSSSVSSSDYRYNSTSHYDTLYNRLNETNSTSRLLSTQNNTDLLNSLRLKFLI